MSRAAELRAEGHEFQAKAHARFAEAERLESKTPAKDGTKPSWIPSAESPLGNRPTLALCRTGALESSKVGRKVLVKRSSLSAYLERHRRDADASDADEDLFGARGAR